MRCCAHARGFSRASLACAHATSATPTPARRTPAGGRGAYGRQATRRGPAIAQRRRLRSDCACSCARAFCRRGIARPLMRAHASTRVACSACVQRRARGRAYGRPVLWQHLRACFDGFAWGRRGLGARRRRNPAAPRPGKQVCRTSAAWSCCRRGARLLLLCAVHAHVRTRACSRRVAAVLGSRAVHVKTCVKGGAAQRDGRILPGDMIVAVADSNTIGLGCVPCSDMLLFRFAAFTVIWHARVPSRDACFWCPCQRR